jgi:Asp-tRNA(Asn)/Glu-tRNA(Gln) amidotransferase C subunit
MAHLTVEEQHIKDLLKQAILELLEERQDIFRQLVAEAMEDLALINAIKEGEATETISREEILQILEGVA